MYGSRKFKGSKKKMNQVFGHTATKTKKINVSPKITRGGIRL